MVPEATSGIYEVLNPWAEVDPIPLKGITPRLNDLNNKKIGLFHNDKVGAAPSLSLIEAALKEKFSNIQFSHFLRTPNISMAEIKEWDKFADWVKGLDAVIFAVGD
jgi:hypothetical protein